MKGNEMSDMEYTIKAAGGIGGKKTKRKCEGCGKMKPNTFYTMGALMCPDCAVVVYGGKSSKEETK